MANENQGWNEEWLIVKINQTEKSGNKIKHKKRR